MTRSPSFQHNSVFTISFTFPSALKRKLEFPLPHSIARLKGEIKISYWNCAYQSKTFLNPIAFNYHIRFLYNIPRYSEDLDFSLIEPDKDCGFVEVLRRIKFLFESENYGISIKISPTKTI